MSRAALHRARSASSRGLEGAVLGFLVALLLLATADLASWLLALPTVAALEELQGVFLTWFAFLAAAWGVERGLHLSVDLLVNRLGPSSRRWIDRIARAATALLGLLLAVHGLRLVGVVSNTLPATGLPASLQYAAAVVGGAFLAAFAFFPGDSEEAPGE